MSPESDAVTKFKDDDRTPFKLAIQNNTYGYKTLQGTFVAFRGDSTATYTYATNSTGGTVDMGARNNYRYVNATNVYNKGKSDGVTVHTGTYTFAANDTGSTKDLGVNHTYRYVNATNVYNKGKSDGGGIIIKKNYYLTVTANLGITASPIRYNERFTLYSWNNFFVNSADISTIEAFLNMYNYGVNIASDGTVSQTQIYNSTATGWKSFDLTPYQSMYKYFSLCVYGTSDSLSVAFYQ